MGLKLQATLVRGDDWEGLYINGQLLTEGHSIRIDDVLEKLLGIDTKKIDADDAWLWEQGRLPKNLDEVKFQ